MTKHLVCAFLLAVASHAAADDKPMNPEQWMFDDKPITATSPGKGKRDFAVTGRIYSRVFYDRPIRDVFSLTPKSYQINVYVKYVGGSYSTVPIWIPQPARDKHWLDVEILPDPKTAKTKYGAYGQTFYRVWSESDKRYSGKHPVFFQIIAGGGNGSAPTDLADADERAAEVTIDFTGHDPKKMYELSTRVAAAGDQAFSSQFSLPKPGALHSAKLAKQAEAMTRRGNKNITAVKVIFTDASWGIERHELTGRILSRAAGASAVVKTRAGKCMVEPGVIRQQYMRGKFVAPGAWLNTSATPYQIDCAKAFR